MNRNRRAYALGICILVSIALSLFLLQAAWRHAAICGQQVYSLSEMSMPSSGDLKILQIADVQIAHMSDECQQLTPEEKTWPCNGRNTTAFVKRLIEYDRPDLVIFTGDNVYAPTSDAYSRKLLTEITRDVFEAGIQFALVIGNHDVEMPWVSVTNMHRFMRRRRSEMGGGALLSGNGLIRITAQEQTLIHIHLFDYMHQYCIFCLHGAESQEGEAGAYRPVTESQIRDFERNSNSSVTSIAFAHIPLKEYDDLLVASKRNVLHRRMGFNYEKVSYGSPNRLYDALQAKNVKLFSAGHDHINDFCGRKQGGVYLCYSGGIGYTTYGSEGWPRRARMFIITKHRTATRIRTYKRLDDANFSRMHDEYIEESL